MVLGTVPGALSGPSCVLGGLRPASSASLYSPFIVVSFLLNGVPRVVSLNREMILFFFFFK